MYKYTKETGHLQTRVRTTGVKVTGREVLEYQKKDEIEQGQRVLKVRMRSLSKTQEQGECHY